MLPLAAETGGKNIMIENLLCHRERLQSGLASVTSERYSLRRNAQNVFET
jgi:hypothetical protein